jgi:hypothetical protein
MSNYNTTLQSNNVDLQEVLQTLQTKTAGGGSGAAVETCTVTIVNNSYNLIDILYCSHDNDITNTRLAAVMDETTITLDNVVKNSHMCLASLDGIGSVTQSSGGGYPASDYDYFINLVDVGTNVTITIN